MVGQPDAQFGQAGKVLLPVFEQSSAPLVLEPAPDGGFLTAQSQTHQELPLAEVRRFGPDGQPHLSFSSEGVRSIQLEGAIHDMAIGPDSTIYLCGYVQRGRNRDVWAMRLLPDGRTDPSFGNQGVSTFSIGEQTVATRIHVFPSGACLLAGTRFEPQDLDRDIVLLKLGPDGKEDVAFGRKGHIFLDISQEDKVSAMVLRPDGRILLGATTRPGRLSRFTVIRLLPNGMKDPAFGEEGVVQLPIGMEQSFLEDMALLPDASILVGGNAKMNPQDPGFDLVLARLLPEGQWDPRFGNNGTAVFDLGGADYFGQMQVQEDHMVLIGGFSGTDIHVRRMNLQGQLDPTYGKQGASRLEGSSRFRAVQLSLNAEGHLLVGSTTQEEAQVSKLFGNPHLPGLDKVMSFGWEPVDQPGISYAGIDLGGNLRADTWVGGPMYPEIPLPSGQGPQSTEPVPPFIRFFAHLSLDEQHRYTFVWDSEGHAHWYWNGSFRSSWESK